MNDTVNKFGFRRGLSLAVALAALVIGSMVLISLLGIYSRAERATAAVNRKLDSSRLPGEILQRIAEDIDKLTATGPETKITIEPGYQNGYRGSKMTIVRTIKDSKNKDVLLEEIIWQSYYDIESDMEGLVLYRGHSGISLEDKLLDEQRAEWEKGYPMVPICSGVTFFEITVPSGENFLDRWTSAAMPKGVRISISFTEPFEVSGQDSEIPDEYKITRTIAVDRTRTIKFNLALEGPEKGNGVQGNTARGNAARGNAAEGNSRGRTERE
ncbi:MAG: hypothetical protein ACYS8Z_03315 [Planctomycetota bacterium]